MIYEYLDTFWSVLVLCGDVCRAIVPLSSRTNYICLKFILLNLLFVKHRNISSLDK